MMFFAAPLSESTARLRLGLCLASLGAVAVLASCTSQKLDDGYDQWVASETKVAETRAKALYRVHLADTAGNSLQTKADMASGPQALALRISDQRHLFRFVLPNLLGRRHETAQILRANFKRAVDMAVESSRRTLPDIRTDKAELEALYARGKTNAINQLETLIGFCSNGPAFGLPAQTPAPARVRQASASRSIAPGDRLKALSQYARFANDDLNLATGDGAISITGLIANRSRPAASGLVQIARGDFPRTVTQYKKACEPDLDLVRGALETVRTGSPAEVEGKIHAMRATIRTWEDSAVPQLQSALAEATPELVVQKTNEALDQMGERTLAALAVHSILEAFLQSLEGPAELTAAVPNNTPIDDLQNESTRMAEAAPMAQSALDGFLAAVPNMPVSAFNGATYRNLAATPLDLELSGIVGEALYDRLDRHEAGMQAMGVLLRQWRERATQATPPVAPHFVVASERFFELLFKRP